MATPRLCRGLASLSSAFASSCEALPMRRRAELCRIDAASSFATALLHRPPALLSTAHPLPCVAIPLLSVAWPSRAVASRCEAPPCHSIAPPRAALHCLCSASLCLCLALPVSAVPKHPVAVPQLFNSTLCVSSAWLRFALLPLSTALLHVAVAQPSKAKLLRCGSGRGDTIPRQSRAGPLRHVASRIHGCALRSSSIPTQGDAFRCCSIALRS